MICLQETKLQSISEAMVSEMLGASFKSNFSFLSAIETSGGILIAASEDHFKLLSSSCTRNTLTVRIQVLLDASEWTLTGVYGPQLEVDKIAFLEELKALRHSIRGELMINNDFNLIYRVEDKRTKG